MNVNFKNLRSARIIVMAQMVNFPGHRLSEAEAIFDKIRVYKSIGDSISAWDKHILSR